MNAKTEISVCRLCGDKGSSLDEFTSPYTDLCVRCATGFADADRKSISPRLLHNSHMSGTFGKCEVETSAKRLIAFFAVEKGNSWASFTFEELHTFFLRNNWNPREILFGLVGNWWDDGGMGTLIHQSWPCIIHYGDGLRVTEHFVRRCAGEFNRKS